MNLFPSAGGTVARFSLLEHLEELRSRLLRVVVAIVVLGGVSLYFARELFNFLMQPVLDALPVGSRALVYTSGIEQFNVLLKVGCYAGLILAVPVALYQIWKFVGPGLLPNERHLVAPFIGLGTAFFIGGAAFCYFGVLPTMFRFLLDSEDHATEHLSVAHAEESLDDATRLLLLGSRPEADALIRSVLPASPAKPSTESLERRLDALGHLLDKSLMRPLEPAQSAALVEAVSLRRQVRELLDTGDRTKAEETLDSAAAAWGHSFPAPEMAALLWQAEQQIVLRTASLEKSEWTKPMLSMDEQLSLVLVLELAFGLIFEMPLVMALLAMLGLIRFRWIYRGQRVAILLCVIAAAIITPTGDVVNLSLMAVPMIACYEAGLILVWLLEKRRDARKAAEGMLAAD